MHIAIIFNTEPVAKNYSYARLYGKPATYIAIQPSFITSYRPHHLHTIA